MLTSLPSHAVPQYLSNTSSVIASSSSTHHKNGTSGLRYNGSNGSVSTAPEGRKTQLKSQAEADTKDPNLMTTSPDISRHLRVVRQIASNRSSQAVTRNIHADVGVASSGVASGVRDRKPSSGELLQRNLNPTGDDARSNQINDLGTNDNVMHRGVSVGTATNLYTNGTERSGQKEVNKLIHDDLLSDDIRTQNGAINSQLSAPVSVVAGNHVMDSKMEILQRAEVRLH
jgi:hypothetical protein